MAIIRNCYIWSSRVLTRFRRSRTSLSLAAFRRRRADGILLNLRLASGLSGSRRRWERSCLSELAVGCVRHLPGWYFTKIKEIDQSVSSAVAAIAELKTEVTGRVVLAGGATFCIYILPPVLRMLRSAHPKIEIVVRTGSTRDIMMWLEDNTIDLAIVSTPPSSRHLSVKPFLSDELVAICPADEPVRPAHFTAAMLASEPLIMLPHGGGARQVIDPWFKTAGHVCKPTMELGMIDAIKRLVRAKLGYSIVPRMAVDETPEAFGIRLVPLFPPIYRTLSLVIREDKHLSRSLREVILAFQNSVKPV